MSTQSDPKWRFWRQTNPLFWEGWVLGGNAVLVVVAVATVLLLGTDGAAEIMIIIGLAVPVSVLPYYLGMKRWLRDTRAQLERARATQLEIQRMLVEADELRIRTSKQALKEAGGSDG